MSRNIGCAAVAIVAVMLFAATGCNESGAGRGKGATPGRNDTPRAARKGTSMAEKVVKTDEEWRKILTPEQYRITRKKGTERAFTGEYYGFKGSGTYLCVCCGNVLFSSRTKYDSRTGWPSFWTPVSEDRIRIEKDTSLGMVRREVLCRRCDAHLGHVFEDGPRPTGLRYCINSAALSFVEDEGGKGESSTGDIE